MLPSETTQCLGANLASVVHPVGAQLVVELVAGLRVGPGEEGVQSLAVVPRHAAEVVPVHRGLVEGQFAVVVASLPVALRAVY
jgi:hypothetical protein